MMKFDHLALPVANLAISRDWYVSTLGLRIEFEMPERRATALQDSGGFAIFLQEVSGAIVPSGIALWFQVADVDASFAGLSRRGVTFAHAPRKTFWGYGAELMDPDGYLLRLWDERTMKEN